VKRQRLLILKINLLYNLQVIVQKPPESRRSPRRIMTRPHNATPSQKDSLCSRRHMVKKWLREIRRSAGKNKWLKQDVRVLVYAII
jgi:hypothetical protein